MDVGNKLPGVLALIAALALALPAGAVAGKNQEMLLQDDQQLIYSTPQHAAATLRELKQMGVDRVRVSVVWSLIAPDANSSTRPDFNATDPGAYPRGAWFRYDFLVRVAQQLGIKVYFQLTAPAPDWATPPPPLAQGYRYTHDPNAQQYGEFVQAVGDRYSGRYIAPNGAGQQLPLPKVDYWGIWNEPNIGGWMTPQWNTLRSGKKVEAAPAIYRGMVDAAWLGLVRTGHRYDTVMLGETAAYGANHKGYGASMDPLIFTRAFYCVGPSYKPLRGRLATQVGCPRAGNRAAFVRAHPALFYAKGWAHHPYDFDNAPGLHRRDPNASTLSGLSHIEAALDSSFRAYRMRPGIPIYITEWGYQTNPPNPFQKFTAAQQAAYLNQGEYTAWANPRVRAFAQFLLVDDAPNMLYPPGSRAYWSTFDSGLLFYPTDQPKPAYYAFELPIWLPQAKHGNHVPVWAQIRSTMGAAGRIGTLQFQPRGSQRWTAVAKVRSAGVEGFISTHVRLRSAGGLRLAWTDGAGTVQYSRTAAVR